MRRLHDLNSFGLDLFELDEPPTGGPIKAILVGIGVALIPAIYGICCIVSQQGLLIGKAHDKLVIHGTAATGLGIAVIGVAAFIHFHWFWGLIPKLAPFAVIGKIASLVALIAGLGIVFYQFVVLM